MLKTRLILSLFSAVQIMWLNTEKIKIKKDSRVRLGNVDAFSVSDGPSDSLKLPLSSQGCWTTAQKNHGNKAPYQDMFIYSGISMKHWNKKHVHNSFPGAFGMSGPVKAISGAHGLNHLPVCSYRSRSDPWHWQADMWLLQIHENKWILVISHQFSTKPKVF